MKRVLFSGLLLTVLVTGCGGQNAVSDAEYQVSDNNIKVNQTVILLESTKEMSSFLQEEIRTALSGGAEGLMGTKVSSISSTLSLDAVDAASKYRNYFDGLITSQRIRIEEGLAEEDEEPYTYESLFDTYVTVHYMLNLTTNEVEQVFVFRSPTGENKLYTFKWIGGAYIGSEVLGW